MKLLIVKFESAIIPTLCWLLPRFSLAIGKIRGSGLNHCSFKHAI